MWNTAISHSARYVIILHCYLNGPAWADQNSTRPKKQKETYRGFNFPCSFYKKDPPKGVNLSFPKSTPLGK